MATQAEIAQSLKDATAALTDIAAEVDKVGTETDTLITKVAELQAIVDSQGQNASDELVAAAAAVTAQANVLKAKITAVDDKVTDAAPPTNP